MSVQLADKPEQELERTFSGRRLVVRSARDGYVLLEAAGRSPWSPATTAPRGCGNPR